MKLTLNVDVAAYQRNRTYNIIQKTDRNESPRLDRRSRIKLLQQIRPLCVGKRRQNQGLLGCIGWRGA